MAYARKLLLGSWHIALIILTVILGLHVVAVLWLDVDAILARIQPPRGPIAERLAKLDHTFWGAETSVVQDLFAARASVNLLGKRRKTDFEKALSAAKFSCTQINPTEKNSGYIFCDNKTAGCTDEGYIMTWIIFGKLTYMDPTKANTSDIRSFTKISRYC